MVEPPSPLLKSRIPRKTIIVDPNLFTHDEGSEIYDLHCPLQKGIIYYRWNGAIFEHNIYSSGTHERRIIVPNHPSRGLTKFLFVPIKGNRILLFARYFGKASLGTYLHVSIYEIRSNHRVGPALWSSNGSADESNTYSLITSTENQLGITVAALFDYHWKLFDISTTQTGGSNNFPLIESGRINFGLELKSSSVHGGSHVILSPDRHILLKADVDVDKRSGRINIHYLEASGTNDTNFSLVSRMLIPVPGAPENFPAHPRTPFLAFSADGSKFAMAQTCGRVSVWDIRSKLPLKTFGRDLGYYRPVRHLQFSGGLGKELLVFVERNISTLCDIIYVIDATSFETEEMLRFKLGEEDVYGINIGVDALFFDPSGGTLYAEHNGTLYEWDLQKGQPDPEWWIGE